MTRPDHAALRQDDRFDERIYIKIRVSTIISLFAVRPSHLSVPLTNYAAVAQIAGQGRSIDRRFSASPLRGTSAMAGWRQAGRTVFAMAISLCATMQLMRPAHAQSTFSSTIIVQPTRINEAGFITEAARRFGIPARWICAVIQVESGNNPDAVSPKGALGLMQLMPTTYAAMRTEYHLGADPFAPHDNIIAGTAYLRAMYDHFGPDGFLAAYNCGPACYDEHLSTGSPLPVETQIYVARLMPVIDGSQNAMLPMSNIGQNITLLDSIFPTGNVPNATRASLFVVQSQRSPSTESLQPEHRVSASANADFSTSNESFSMPPRHDSTGFQHDSMNALMPSKHLLSGMFVPVSAGIPPHG